VTLKTLFGLAACALLASSASAQAAKPQKLTSDSDKLEASADHLARMKAGLKQVLGRVEEARNEKDVVKLNCTNEKLTQIKSLLKVAEQADAALHEAVSNRDPSADAELSKVAIARAKIDALRGESEQCIGQLAYIVDEKTVVEVQQPSNLPDPADRQLFGRGGYAGASWAAPPVIRPGAASPSGIPF
jgi:hypothetical protein